MKIIEMPPSASVKLDRFYRFWTLKESLIKALGGGIPSYQLADLEFVPDSTVDFWKGTVMGPVGVEASPIVDSTIKFAGRNVVKDANKWIFELSYLDSRHCVAIAIDTTGMGSKEGKIGFPFHTLDVARLVEKMETFES